MISIEERARIRRLFYAEHWKVGTIATQLSVHRDTVLLAIEAERFRTRDGVVHPSQLDPYKSSSSSSWSNTRDCVQRASSA